MTAPQGSITTADARHYPIQGHNLPSVSTINKALAAKGLEVWRQKRIAYAIAVDDRLRAKAANEDTVYYACRDALDSAPTDASDVGTDVHTWTEWYDAGHPLHDVPRNLNLSPTRSLPFVEQWIDMRDEYGIDVISAERTVAHMELGYAGSYDRIVALDHGAWKCCDDCEEPGHTLDIKTGKDIYGSTALQLAAYTYAPEEWLPDTDELVPRVPACHLTGLVAGIHEDRYVLVPMGLPDAWRVVRTMPIAWLWQSELEKSNMGLPLPRRRKILPW